jgi:glycosyltransferase involved in cell wall biosynthesis
MKQTSPEKISVLVAVPETSSASRMIYELPFRELPAGEFSWRIVIEYYMKAEDLQEIQILIIYRCVQGATLSLIRLARAKRIKVIYEIDDDLLEPPGDECWGKRYRERHISEIIQMFLTEADLVKAGSPELAHRLNQKGYPVIYQPFTAKICDPLANTTGPPYRIGYFGSPHHRKDIEMIVPALLATKELFQARVEFEFFGCYPEGWEELSARVLPYEPDYEVFMRRLTERCWVLGLAPLRGTKFNHAKSNSKFRDFTAAGILGIYTDLTPYRDTVIDGESGWLAGDDPDRWFEIILKALSCTGRPAMLSHARKIFNETYHPKIVARNWMDMIKRLL